MNLIHRFRSPGLFALPGLSVLIMAGLMALSLPALGFDPESEIPIRVQADAATLDDGAGTAVYEGRVTVTQGETRLEADRVTVFRSDAGLDRLEAEGEPATYRQPAGDDDPEINAQALRIHYEHQNGILTFERRARIEQEQDSFRGDHITYDIRQRIVRARGGEADEESDGRVEMTITPRPRQSSQE